MPLLQMWNRPKCLTADSPIYIVCRMGISGLQNLGVLFVHLLNHGQNTGSNLVRGLLKNTRSKEVRVLRTKLIN